MSVSEEFKKSVSKALENLNTERSENIESGLAALQLSVLAQIAAQLMDMNETLRSKS